MRKVQRQPGDQWYSVRWSVLERDQFTCRYCGQFAPNVILHVDHVTPVCEEGTDDLDNLVTACSACNIGKERYRAKTAREQQRKGRQRCPLNGTPSLDPAIIEALGDYPEGLTIKRLAELTNRHRTTVLDAVNRIIREGGPINVQLIRTGHNPARLYRLTV